MWFLNQQITAHEDIIASAYNQVVGQTTPLGPLILTPVTIVGGLLLAGLSFLITWAIGKPVLAWLRIKKLGKRVRDDGPQSHLVKTGTPTMGGIMMSISILIVAVGFILIPLLAQGKGLSVLLPIGIVLSC